MKPRTKKMLSLLLIFTTLVVVVVIGLQDSNLSGTIRAVRNLGWQYIAYCTLCYFGFLLCDALSIRFFLRRRGYRIDLAYALYVSVAGQYYANITPGATGGQPMQVYYLHRRYIPAGVATSALVVRFFCYQFMLSLIGTVLWIAYGPFVAEHTGSNRWMLILGYTYNALAVTVLITFVLVRPLVRWLVSLVIRIGARLRLIKHPEETRDRWMKSVDTFHSSIAELLRRPSELLVQLLLGGAQLMCLMSVIWFVYRGLGLHSANYGQLVTMNVMEYLSAAYTPLPGASGAQEGVFSLYFGQLFPDGTMFAALLLWRFFTYYISLLLGAVVMVAVGLRSGKSLREISRMQEEADQQTTTEEM